MRSYLKVLLLNIRILEEARKALLAKIRNEGMSEDDVAKLMSVFDNQGKTIKVMLTSKIHYEYLLFIFETSNVMIRIYSTLHEESICYRYFHHFTSHALNHIPWSLESPWLILKHFTNKLPVLLVDP